MARRDSTGQAVTEMALLLPVLLIFVLVAVDFAKALSAQQRLERAAHLATIRLATDPSLGNSTLLTAYIQQQSGLQPAAPGDLSAGATYALNTDASDQVVVTATYNYPLILPGLRNLQAGSIGGGKLRMSVTAAGIAATTAPSVITATAPLSLSVVAPADATAPTGLAAHLTCTATINQTSNSSPCPLYWPTTPPSGPYTATVTQENGVVSPPTTGRLP